MNAGSTSADTRDPLTFQVIGEAMRVHSELRPGLEEVFDHELLARRLAEAGLACESRPRGTLWHRSRKADEFECDLRVEHQVILELKVLAAETSFAPEHLAQILCYLKFWKARGGLLLDFGKERLMHWRVVLSEKAVASPDTGAWSGSTPEFVRDRRLALTILASLARVLEMHGLGYRDTTYRGLVTADLAAEGVAFVEQPTVTIRSSGVALGEAKCHCTVVAGEAVVVVVALRHRISTTDRAILQTYLKLLGLPWGVIANFGKTQFDVMFVSPPSGGPKPGPSRNEMPSAHPRSSLNLRGT